MMLFDTISLVGMTSVVARTVLHENHPPPILRPGRGEDALTSLPHPIAIAKEQDIAEHSACFLRFMEQTCGRDT